MSNRVITALQIPPPEYDSESEFRFRRDVEMIIQNLEASIDQVEEMKGPSGSKAFTRNNALTFKSSMTDY